MNRYERINTDDESSSSDEEVFSKEEILDSGTETDCSVEAGIADSDREPTSDEVGTTETRVVVGRTETKFDPAGATIGSDAELVRTDRMKLDLDAKSGEVATRFLEIASGWHRYCSVITRRQVHAD